MEVTRQEDRKRASRSRWTASNKENICPLEGSDLTAQGGCRRSPLPEGFPRSPLQDITHIIGPHNIWPHSEYPLPSQVRKKLKKGNLAERSTTIEMERSSNWKALMPCMEAKLGKNQVQSSKVTSNGEKDVKQSTVTENVANRDEAKEDGFQQGLCTHRDEAKINASNVQKMSIRRFDSVEQIASDEGKAHVKSCALQDLKMISRERRDPIVLLRGEVHKRPWKSSEMRKKSSILMFR